MTTDRERLERAGLYLLVASATVILSLVVWRFRAAMLWAVLAGILFQPLFKRMLARWPERPSRAAAATFMVVIVALVIPAIILASLVAQQAAALQDQLSSGRIDVGAYFQQLHDALPARLQRMLNSSGLGTLQLIQGRIEQALTTSASAMARQAFTLGANAAAFLLSLGVGLYLTFFMIRDGDPLGRAIVTAMPLRPQLADHIASKCVIVVRATIKGSGVVALVQGALGAATFWLVGLQAPLLWGVVMAVAALLPAVGPAIIWAPIAIFLFATGELWQAVVVVLSGVFVIGLIDNLLRPILVGRDVGMPDWMVLVTTLGGISLMGLSGVVAGPLAGAIFIAAWSALKEQRQVSAGLPT
ncbi:AI-2E family transporter [Sphingomonas sp. BN140010]|uniref:AI-2E family transporter n=1 Tax=Sphingomonas arvum TaxID=2992113 RepID=A0ABT3JBP8_9SPHN|nr:AI-2E family transporter [Sphingomonas sp. BN140010]MCW3796493.1 AI-2E family transporter [Sphingomonas sp. BN140010]